jgi:predicted MPP superfamily phosphohydrolase
MRNFEDTDRYKILLSHLPYPWIDYGFCGDYDIDMIFSGHIHGDKFGYLLSVDYMNQRQDGFLEDVQVSIGIQKSQSFYQEGWAVHQKNCLELIMYRRL